ncbi:hypothetical protein AAC387_Pa05g1062 [Persea americana]
MVYVTPMVKFSLYVCDASLIPCPIGTNPSLSILTAAEHVSSHLVNDILKYKSINQPTDVPNGEAQLPLNQQDLQDLSKLHVGINGNPIMEKRSNEVLIKETLSGHLGGMPCTAHLIMKMDSKAYNKAGTTMGDPHPNLKGKISMAILGPNKILPLYENIKAIPRHQLLKFILRLIPRYERCIFYECEVFAGIFGNTFWHQNITPTMHHFLHKQSLPQFSLGGLPHLTKICVKGHIVNAKGKDIYLIHPERMTIPTLYISSGRSILVTPETSLLANQYMKLHQPGFRHRRVVVEGFGHSDLLIGEESYKKVFPHMISHLKLSEHERNGENM